MTGQIPATPETVQRPKLQRLLRYWHERRGDRPLPARSDIDPLHFPWLLGNISLVDVHHGEDGVLRYRFRLMGSRAVQRLQYDLTGKWLEELGEADYRVHLTTAYTKVVQNRIPTIEQSDMLIDDQRQDFEILRLPFSNDNSKVDMLMLAVDFVDPNV